MVHTKGVSLIKSKSETKSLITGNNGFEIVWEKARVALDIDETFGEIDG